MLNETEQYLETRRELLNQLKIDSPKLKVIMISGLRNDSVKLLLSIQK